MREGPQGVPAGDSHRRPDGVDDPTVEAVGAVTEALEWVERARGRLYDFHHLIGHAAAVLVDAAEQLEAAGHGDAAARLRVELVGRNVLEGRWTFQVLEEFDATYWEPFRAAERHLRDALLEGRPHVHEAELKARRRSPDGPHQEWRP